MSVILQQKKTTSPYDKLIVLLETGDETVVEKIKSDCKVKNEICIGGFLHGIMKGEGKGNIDSFDADAKKLGFTKDDLDVLRRCVVNGCPFYGELFGTLNHLVGFHKIPFKNVAKLIPIIKDDEREVPHGLNAWKTAFQTQFMGTD